MTTINQSRQEVEARLLTQAQQDPAFRQALINDPKGTLARFLGLTLPEGMKITVLEEEPGHHYLVLPPAPPSLDAIPLDDLELALVGGGRTLRPTPSSCTNTRKRLDNTQTTPSSAC
jgi:hypothetical protein